MIAWDGAELHDPERPAGCWATGASGAECGRPAGQGGLCAACRSRLDLPEG